MDLHKLLYGNNECFSNGACSNVFRLLWFSWLPSFFALIYETIERIQPLGNKEGHLIATLNNTLNKTKVVNEAW
jgi:hypothetical protein